MFSPRTRFALQQLSGDVLVMKTNPARRLLFFAMAALLFVAFLTGFSAEADLSGGRLGGTIFYAVLFFICFGVSIWETRYVFDASDRCVRYRRRIAGFRVSAGETPLDDSAAIVVQQVQLIKESEQPERRGLFGSRFRGYAARRNSLGKLVVETAERSHFLDDSAHIEELESTGRAIAEFLDLPYRKDEV